jgi:hypothetical protein
MMKSQSRHLYPNQSMSQSPINQIVRDAFRFGGGKHMDGEVERDTDPTF